MKLLKKLVKNKTLYVMLLFLVLFFPSGIKLNSEIDMRAVATAIGIDKSEEGLELSALVVIPNKDGTSEKVQLASAEGKDLSDAINKVSLSLGKILGLAHCEAIVIGEDAMKENLADQMDYFVRSSNMAANSMVINCDKKAKDLLEALASDDKDLALSLKSIITFNNEYLFTSDTDVETFYRNYFSKSNSTFIPIISLEEQAEESSSGGSQGSSDSGQQTAQTKKILSEGRTAVVKNGVKVRELKPAEVSGYNFLSKKVQNGNITIEDVTDENFKNATLDFEIERQKVSKKVKFKDGKPVYDIKIKMVLKLKAVKSEGYNYQMQDSTKQYVTPEVQAKIKEKITGQINTIFNEMRENKTDTLFIYRDFNRFHNKKWEKYLNSLENEENYLDGITVNTNIEMYGRL